MGFEQSIVISKEIVSTGSGLLLWIPKSIVKHYKLDNTTFVSAILHKCDSEKCATFLKKIGKSQSNYFIWINQDVTEYLSLKAKDLVNIELKIL